MSNAAGGLPEDLLWTLAARIVPPSQTLDAAGKERFFRIIRDTMATRPGALRRQFRLFLLLLRWAPVFKYGSTLAALAPEKQDEFLRSLQNSPVVLLRKGFWGLKTVLFMGFYGQIETQAVIGYRASKEGNSLLKPRAGPVS